MTSEFKRLFWVLVGFAIGYYIAQHLLPETPKREAKQRKPDIDISERAKQPA